jgi:hypothetical protein
MAYCVQCGVKLEEGSKQCPLCNTEVLLPKGVQEQPSEPLFAQPLPPAGMGGITKTRKGVIELILSLFVVSELTVALSMILSGNVAHSFIPLFSIAMAALSLILAFSNKPTFQRQASIQFLLAAVYLLGIDAADRNLSWSLVASPALGLLWMYVVFPSHARISKAPRRSVVLVVLSTLAYLALVNGVLSGSLTWFVPVALPSLLVLVVLCWVFLFWFSRRRNKSIPLADIVLGTLVVLFLSATVFDLFLSKYQRGVFILRWSESLLLSGLIILLFLVSVSVSRRVRRYFTSHNRHS